MSDSVLRAALSMAGAAGLAVMLPGCASPEHPQPRGSDAGVTHHARNGHTEPDWLPAPESPAWKNLVSDRLKIPRSPGAPVGSAAWMEAVGRAAGVTDASGHGPDAGSAEWYHAVDRKVFGRRP